MGERLSKNIMGQSVKKHVPLMQRSGTYMFMIYSSWFFATAITFLKVFYDAPWASFAFIWIGALYTSLRTRLFAKYYRGMECLRAGKIERAEALFNKVKGSLFAGRGFQWFCCVNLVYIRSLQLDWAGLVELAERSLKFCGNNPVRRKNSLVNLHAALAMFGRKNDAEALVSEIERFPPNPSLDFTFSCNRAYIFILDNRFADALTQIEPYEGQVIKSSDENICLFHAEMAFLMRASGREAESARHLRKINEFPVETRLLCMRQNPALASVFEERQHNCQP